MLTLFHAPNSRSSAIVTLIDEMDIADRVDLRVVTVPRHDGSGAADPANPHPEAKVPALVHDGQVITERAAIILHLTTLFPDRGLAPRVGTADWGRFVMWLTWYQGVLEPVLIHEMAGLSHPYLTSTFRGSAEVKARLRAALEEGPWLLGGSYSAADLLVHSPYAWLPDATPDDDLIRDWVARCMARPARQRTLAADAARMAA
ncbi:glutathione S-transferase family protein [Frigidibacter sp. RF13]|uniref:glutathione S-transferase family protein n=1 Tax=Frigidibacter sp. RF13 TaxID=2997340 RepID=UPI00226E392D|nr:glutathione S-transferase family protein [Frigidibacter sp. RF13]MCY1128302.1 glutathione S-transferase family protein [Frigidibacter sp. RF13]